MNKSSHFLAAICLACATASAAFAADDATQMPGGFSNSGEATITNVSAKKPTVEEIHKQLLLILNRSNKYMPGDVVDSKTKEAVTDFSKPSPTAVLNLGPYPFGVINNGALLTAEATGDKAFSDYVVKRFTTLHDSHQFFVDQAKDIGIKKSSVRRFLAPAALDDCGAWGASMIRANIATLGPDMKDQINVFADYITNKQFRLEDGTLARNTPQPKTVWADDMYMCVPFLAQMGAMTKDNKYFDDACKQVLGISSRLYRADKGIYAHGWIAGNARNLPDFYWGRANGWCCVAIAELLSVLPKDHPQYEAVLNTFRQEMKGVAQYQSGTGMWHQLLDRPDSFEETSASAMFVFAFARGINRGWLSAASYGPIAVVGWDAVEKNITPEGGVEKVCIGTNFGTDVPFYYNRPARDDAHGYGAVLYAGAEMINLLNNKKVDIIVRRDQPLTAHEKGADTE